MQFHRKVWGAVLAAFALGLAACATPPSVNPMQMAQIRSGVQSAIIMSYREYNGMYGASVRFMNLETRGVYGVSMHGGDNWVNAGPDMVAVPPGRYRVLSGSLYGYEVSGNMPLLAYWFDDFEVAPGEVVDIGTLTIDDVNVRSIPGMTSQIFNALFTLDSRDRSTYFAYNIDYSDEARVAHMLESKYPELGVAPVRRPLSIVLDRTQFEQTILEAYSPNAEGALPSTAEAQARLNVSLNRFVAESHVRAARSEAAQDEAQAPAPAQ